MDKQSFNLNADFLSGFPGIFMKIIVAVFLMYAFILLLNFFRDKFINNESTSKQPNIINLISILYKIMIASGFGFILANLTQFLLNQASSSHSNFKFGGTWDNLTFGILLIFIGIGFKGAKKLLIKDQQSE